MAVVSGVWTFNEVVTVPGNNNYSVKFTSNGKSCTKIRGDSVNFHYYFGGKYNMVYQDAWVDDAYRTVDFGTEEQTVSDAFYAWLVENAAALGDNDEPQIDQQYAIKESSLIAIADAIRAKTGKLDMLTPLQMVTEIDSIQVGGSGDILNAEPVSFSAEQIEPDVRYSIGYNWFAQVVKYVQEMVGTRKALKPSEIIYYLGTVLFIAQGQAESTFVDLHLTGVANGLLFVIPKGTAHSVLEACMGSSADGILPTVYKGIAHSELNLIFESSANGALSE